MIRVVVTATVLVIAVVHRRRRLAARLTRSRDRVDGAWLGLERSLRARADAAVAVLDVPGVDPALALLVADAAATAESAGLDRPRREQAESDLTQIIEMTALAGLDRENGQIALGRRLHNDAVVRARSLRARRDLRLLGLHDRLVAPTPFEMAEPGAGLRS